jgi:hypothetical protein
LSCFLGTSLFTDRVREEHIDPSAAVALDALIAETDDDLLSAYRAVFSGDLHGCDIAMRRWSRRGSTKLSHAGRFLKDILNRYWTLWFTCSLLLRRFALELIAERLMLDLEDDNCGVLLIMLNSLCED